MQERLQKVLAAAGIASRRSCEELIEQGRVSVNGKTVKELGTKVDIAVDKVIFDGRHIKAPDRYYYIALNKPRGVASTTSDPHSQRTVIEYVDLQKKPFLRPVGRLDVDTEGLILLTDDGDFIYKITHPKHHIGKTYKAVLKGVPAPGGLAKLNTGVQLEDGMTQPAKGVRMSKVTREADGSGRCEVELTIFEGRNRQVRRMFSAIGCSVQRLVRTRIGDVRLTDIPSGGWRHLTQNEIASLLREAEGGSKEEKRSKPTPARGATIKETDSSWQTEKQASKPLKGTSPSSSSKPKPPSPPRTSSSSPRAASTMGSPSTATSRIS